MKTNEKADLQNNGYSITMLINNRYNNIMMLVCQVRKSWFERQSNPNTAIHVWYCANVS